MSKYEQLSPFFAAFCFVLMSAGIESFLAREISPSLHGRMSFVFTFGLAFVAVIACLSLRPKRFFAVLLVNIPFQLYSLFAVASTTWSINPTETLKSSIALLAFHQVGMCMAVLFSWRTIWMGLAWAILFLAGAGVLSIPMGGLMDEIHVGAFRGLWAEKNATGEALAVGALACVVTGILGRSPRYLAGALMLLALIVFARSATSLFACCAAIAAFLTIETVRRGPVRFFTSTWVIVIAICLVAILLFGMGSDIAKLAGRETTFTGRTEIWPTVLRYIDARPWLGYGFQAFWVDGSDTKLDVMINAKFEAHNAHNSYFELTLGFGLIGASLVGFALARGVYQACGALYGVNGIRRTFIPFLLLALTVSFFESTVGSNGGMAAFVLGVLVPKVAEGACLNRKKLPRN